MIRLAAALVALGAVACELSEESFHDRLGRELCKYTDECLPERADGPCLEAPPPVGVGCAYDAREAARCLRGVRRMSCPEPGEFTPLPESCSLVWDCS